MVHISKYIVLLLIYTFICAYCKNTQGKNNSDVIRNDNHQISMKNNSDLIRNNNHKISMKTNSDLIRNNNHKISIHDVYENIINVSDDDARSEMKVKKYRKRRFIFNELESDEESSTDYCDCESPNTQTLYICINYFPVPLSVGPPGAVYYYNGQATFAKDELVHITCKHSTNSPVEIRILGVTSTVRKPRRVIYEEIDVTFASEIDIKLTTYGSYKIECVANGTINVVFLKSRGSYTYPVKDVPANIKVNGLVLSPLCMKSKKRKNDTYLFFKYFTYEGENILIDAKLKGKHQLDCHMIIDTNTSKHKKVRFPFEFIKENQQRRIIVCFIEINSKLTTIEVQFVNYRVTEPFVYGLSWSRAYKRYENNNEEVVDYLYKKNETLQLVVISKDPTTIVRLDNKEKHYFNTIIEQQFGKNYYQELNIDPFFNKSIFVSNDKGSNLIEFIRDSDEERIVDRENYVHLKLGRVLVRLTTLLTTMSSKSPTSPTTASPKLSTSPTASPKSPTSPTTMSPEPPTSPTTSPKSTTSPTTSSKSPTSPTTLSKSPTSPTTSPKSTTSPTTMSPESPTSPTTMSPKSLISPTAMSPEPPTSPTTSTKSLISPTAMSPESPTSPPIFDSNVSMLGVIIVVSIISLGLIGSVLACVCFRAAKRAEPSVLYSRRESHIYEELPDGKNIAERPPYPLPTEELIDDNISYINIHYDSPYDWRKSCFAR